MFQFKQAQALLLPTLTGLLSCVIFRCYYYYFRRSKKDFRLRCAIPFEEKTLTLWVPNFQEIIASKNDSITVDRTFIAGSTIGLPTKWKLSMRKVGDRFTMYLKLLESPKKVDNVYANFGYSIPDYGITRDPFTTRDFKNVTSWGFPESVIFLEQFSYVFLEDDEKTLEFKINFTLYNDIPNNSPKFNRMKFASKSRDAVVEDFQTLLDSGVNADITIEWNDGQTLKAHKTVLIARSPVFFKMFEYELTESCKGVVLIRDMSFEAMKAVLKFIYTGKLDENWVHLMKEIAYAADKYDLPLLIKYCDMNLVSACKLDNAWELLEVAKRHRLKIAEGEIGQYIERNIKEIVLAKKAA